MSELSFDDLLSSVLSNKELMTKISSIKEENDSLEGSLPKIIATLSPILNVGKSDTKQESIGGKVDNEEKLDAESTKTDAKTVEIDSTEKMELNGDTHRVDIDNKTESNKPTMLSGIGDLLDKGGIISSLSESVSKNSKLLLALKPYLRKERVDIIDSILKMAQVANLMKLAK